MIEKARTVQAEWADAFDLAARTAFDAEEAAAEKAAQARAQAAATQSKTAPPTPSGTPVPGPNPGTLSNGIKKEPSETDQIRPSSVPANHLNSTPSILPLICPHLYLYNKSASHQHQVLRFYAPDGSSVHHPTRIAASFYHHTCVKRFVDTSVMARVAVSVFRD